MLHRKCQPQLLNVNKIPSQPKKRKKVTLVFDEQKRREFLGGFRKRKLERQKKAKEQLQQQLKEERKRIKQDARERYKKLVSHRNVPELEQLLSRQEYNLEDHTVSILELNVGDLAEGSKWIGQNKIAEDKDKEINSENEYLSDRDDHDDDDDDNQEIIGMPLEEKLKDSTEQKSKSVSREMKSFKDVKRELKKAALKQVQNSKIFRKKQKMEQLKNRKQQKRKLHKANSQKLVQKRGKRFKKKSEN